jgi:hypothetical protein
MSGIEVGVHVVPERVSTRYESPDGPEGLFPRAYSPTATQAVNDTQEMAFKCANV